MLKLLTIPTDCIVVIYLFFLFLIALPIALFAGIRYRALLSFNIT